VGLPDRKKTFRWLRVSTIVVEVPKQVGHSYPLKNTMEGETALTNYIDKLPKIVAMPKEAAS
jgi:hypothetical protein